VIGGLALAALASPIHGLSSLLLFVLPAGI